jgi:hypothetical protein
MLRVYQKVRTIPESDPMRRAMPATVQMVIQTVTRSSMMKSSMRQNTATGISGWIVGTLADILLIGQKPLCLVRARTVCIYSIHST